jgi:hypothetical protein
MIAAMLALVAVLAIGGFVAYRVSLSKDTTVSTEPGKASDAATAPAPVDGSKDASAPAAQSPTQAGTAADATKDQAAAPGPAGETPKSAAGQSSGPAGATTKATAAHPANARHTGQPPPATSAQPLRPPRRPPRACARGADASARRGPQPDRWAQMNDAWRAASARFFRASDASKALDCSIARVTGARCRSVRRARDSDASSAPLAITT